MKKKLEHVKELDGMRGLAAAAVLVLHIFNTSGVDTVAATQPVVCRAVMHISGWGSFGVDVFFVLSGFLITSLLLADKEKLHFFNNFYWKRVLRIQPVYWVHLLVMWFLAPDSHGYVILSLLFIVNFGGYFHVMDAGPAWTLSIEEQFYFVWPQVIRRLSIKNIYRSCITVIVFSGCLRTYMLFVMGHASLRSTWYRFDGLAMGALLACTWMTADADVSPFVRRFLAVFNSRSLLFLALIYESFILTVSFSSRISAFTLLTTNYLVYRLIRYIIYHPGSRPFQCLRSTPLIFLGSISYSLYMYHIFFIFIVDHYFRTAVFTWSHFLWRGTFIVASTVITCVTSLYLMELPAQRLRKYVVKS